MTLLFSGEVRSRVGVSPQLCTSCLRVLSSVIRGSKVECFTPITAEILEVLCKPEVPVPYKIERQ